MATVFEALPIVAAHTGIKLATVRWVARRLVESGSLPRSEGARVPQMDHRSLARLLIGLLCGATGANVVEAVKRYSGLMPGPIGRGHHNALDWATELIEALADRDANPEAGRAAYGSQIEIVASWAEIRITFPDDDAPPLAFVERGSVPGFWQSDKVRRSSSIAGVTLSNLTRDLARVPA